MKTLLLTNANAAFALLGEYSHLYDDNGGTPDGPAWLPSQDEIPGHVSQVVVSAGHGEMVNASIFSDEEICRFLDVPLPDDDEDQQDFKERIAARLEARGFQWAHYGAYGVMDSKWVLINETAEA